MKACQAVTVAIIKPAVAVAVHSKGEFYARQDKQCLFLDHSRQL